MDRDDEEVTLLLTLRSSPCNKLFSPLTACVNNNNYQQSGDRRQRHTPSNWQVAFEPGTRVFRTPSAPQSTPSPPEGRWAPQPPVRRNKPPLRPPRRPSLDRTPPWELGSACEVKIHLDVFNTKSTL